MISNLQEDKEELLSKNPTNIPIFKVNVENNIHQYMYLEYKDKDLELVEMDVELDKEIQKYELYIEDQSEDDHGTSFDRAIVEHKRLLKSISLKILGLRRMNWKILVLGVLRILKMLG